MNGLFKARAKHLNLNRNLNCDYATPKPSSEAFQIILLICNIT